MLLIGNALDDFVWIRTREQNQFPNVLLKSGVGDDNSATRTGGRHSCWYPRQKKAAAQETAAQWDLQQRRFDLRSALGISGG
jgi:hypothetical protein